MAQDHGGYSARTLAWLTADLDREIPSATEAQLEKFRRISARLTPAELSCKAGGQEDLFDLSAEDIFSELTHRQSSTQLLGYYTEYGLELVFEEYGITPHLRQLGYERIRFTFDLSHPTGQLVRVYSDDEASDLLIEIVLDLRFDMPPFKLLWLEWLLCQNPRALRSRPLLPGQQHPGLGCLDRVIGILLMACERLGFDGIAFHPAHYHSSALAKGWGIHAKPENEARYLAIETATSGMTLNEATRLVDQEGLQDERSDEVVHWIPNRMILPSSQRLVQHFNQSEYIQAVQQELEKYKLVRPERLRFSSPKLPIIQKST